MERDSSTTLYVFAVMSVASLAAYLGSSVAVDAFLARVHAMLTKILEMALSA